MSDSGLRVEQREASFLVVIDRPTSKNAMARHTAVRLKEIVEQVTADATIRAIIITGAGQQVFVAGGDLRDFDILSKQPNGAQQVLEMGAMMNALESCAVPVIAAVGGAALGGGCELALACDLVVAEEQATFSFRQAAMGLSTGWGGGTRLVERIGPMQAARLLLVGATIDASEALELGLVTQVVARGGAVNFAQQWVNQIGQLPRNSVRGIKQMLRDVRHELRGNALQKEAEVFSSLWGKAEHTSAMDSFFRRPHKAQ